MTRRGSVPFGRVGILAIRCESKPDRFDEGFNPRVRLVWPDRASDACHLTTLDDFLRDNSEGLSLSDIQAITDHLCAGRVYAGGGGADERWTLEVSPV